jgi:hypothetical protein
MDGFNVIPVDKENFKTATPGFSPPSSSPESTQAPGLGSSIEIIDEEKEKENQLAAEKVSWIFVLSILVLIGAVCYFGFLVFYRITMLAQITDYSEQFRTIGKNINIKEMQEFQAMDTSLRAINGRLNKHVLNSQILVLVNQNIRTSLQVTEYRLDVKEKDVEVNLTAVSPSFKELAEQSEKFFALKDSGVIKSFSVSSLSFESETKRIRFSMRLLFDKSKVTAASINKTMAPKAEAAAEVVATTTASTTTP